MIEILELKKSCLLSFTYKSYLNLHNNKTVLEYLFLSNIVYVFKSTITIITSMDRSITVQKPNCIITCHLFLPHAKKAASEQKSTVGLVEEKKEVNNQRRV